SLRGDNGGLFLGECPFYLGQEHQKHGRGEEALTLGGASSVDDVKTGGHGDELTGGDETRGSTETGAKDSRGSGEHEGKSWEMERC
ncbi:uncharacterized protein An12g00250, partial [Aspergillus niger]|uniref:Uncharacterized protein n=2 Tax=Aspergillus niger TaxID=5061 RepID=A0AAJ8BSF9_ASPNG